MTTVEQVTSLPDGSVPVMSAVDGLIRSLARPVCRGMLPHAHAHAAIATTLARTMPVSDDLEERLALWQHILDVHIDKLEARRDLTAAAIKRVLRPLIAERCPWGVLMAESHDQNGVANFPLTEAEVATIVRREVYFALPTAPRGPRHG